jgi:predicted CXXCH cytochrome family protein
MNVTTKGSSAVAVGVLVAALGASRIVAEEPSDGVRRDHRSLASECLDCHEELREVIERAFPHEPAYEEECTLCHSPHAARYDNLLSMRERALCTACHRDTVLSFMAGEIHTPVREGKCVVCHQVHGSEHAGLLVAEGNQLCLDCHEYQASQTTLPTVHEPFVEGECSDCHDPHGSAHADQLVAPANALCALCHPTDAPELVEAHYEIPVEGTNCAGCHDPHGSIEPGLFLPIAHEPFAEGSCDMCHQVESDSPRLVRATGGRLCQPCHSDYPDQSLAFVHAPVEEGNCSACHVVHASRHPGLTPAGLEETCQTCHVELEERAATARSVHPTRFEDGSSCDACHRPHASDEEDLLSRGGIRTCLACHETERHGHPLGDDRLDPRTGQPITCVTCHDPHGTDFAYQLIGERTRGLCLECHDT